MAKFLNNKIAGNKSGFSLVEVLVATFIFSMVMIGVAGAFSGSVFGYRSAKNTQKDLEQAQFAMNLMAKTIRTSSIGFFTATNIMTFDYSQDKCVQYRWNSNIIQVRFPAGTAPCAATGTWSNLTSANVTNTNFFVVTSCSGDPVKDAGDATCVAGTPRVGIVTISMEVGSGADITRLQTSVSLRDYSVSGL